MTKSTQETINQFREMYLRGVSKREIINALPITEWEYRKILKSAKLSRAMVPMANQNSVATEISRVCKAGSISEVFLGMERQILYWALRETEGNGYSTVAEFLSDLVVDEYYRATEKGG